MNWLERQREIIDMFDFETDPGGSMCNLMSAGKELPAMWEGYVDAENMLQGCISMTYFVCERAFGCTLHIEGMSNSGVMQGVIWVMRYIFEGVNISEIDMRLLNWHKESGLMSHLTPQRQGAVEQIIKRIGYVVGGIDKA